MVGDKEGKGRCGRLDKEHFIDRRVTVRVGRNNIIQEKGWQGIVRNITEKRNKHFEISAQTFVSWTRRTAKYSFSFTAISMVAKDAGRHS